MAQAFIKVLVVAPGEEPEIQTVPNDLEPLQNLVGGLIEPISLNQSVLLVLNEEGPWGGLPFNRRVNGQDILGTFFLVRHDGAGEMTSLTEADLRFLTVTFSRQSGDNITVRYLKN